MMYLKASLSIVAFLVALLSGAAMAGAIAVSAAGISFLLALSGVLATFGVQVFQVTPATARILGAFSLLIAAGLGVHGQWLVAFTAAHLWVNALLHWIGIAGILMGFAATHPITAPPAPATAAFPPR